ncbi:MAG: hypothetical protein JXR66_10735 [Bacteroidales bacterium]|nr:hypothetical protein [Bacteroidales bacterium]MBN2634024.1 hypothetical protein [Bacteroidales bacterium]
MGILTIFILLPLLTIIVILAVRKPDNIRAIARASAVLQLLLSVILIPLYLIEIEHGSLENMLFTEDLMWFGSMNIHYIAGADGITLLMLIISSLAAFAAVFHTRPGEIPPKEFYVLLLLTVSASSGFIVSTDLLTAFVFFAGILVPLFIMQSMEGKGNGKASLMKFILIPAGGAALVLVGLLGVYYNSAPDGNYFTFSSLAIQKYLMARQPQQVFFPMIFTGFAVTGALVPFSIWLPGTLSSMSPELRSFYSGLIIKLGIYGAFRFGIYLMPEGANEVSLYLLPVVAAGVVFGSALTIMQKDLRNILIWSSVSYSGLIFFSLLLVNEMALTGAIVMLFSHGTAVILLFALTEMINTRTGTAEVKSILNLRLRRLGLPVSYLIAVLIMGGVPGSVGFTGWKLMISAFLQENEPLRKISGIVVLVSMAIMIIFILLIALKILFRASEKAESRNADCNGIMLSERITVLILLIPPLVAGFFPAWILSLIDAGLKPLLSRINTINLF